MTLHRIQVVPVIILFTKPMAGALTRHFLMQGAAVRDINNLNPAAGTEYWNSGVNALFCECDFGLVSFEIAVHAIALVGLAIASGIDIVAAGQDQPINAINDI